MPYTIYVPRALDVDFLLRDQPEYVKDKDYLLYLLHLITSVALSNKRAVDKKGFTRLSSTILQSSVRNYNKFLTLLEEQGVIEVNRSYSAGGPKGYSLGYKLASDFQGTLVPYEITKFTLVKSISHDQFERFERAKSIFPNLCKWFNDQLTIDIASAISYLNSDRRDRLSHVNDKNEIQEIERSYRAGAMSAYKIYNKQFSISVDDNTGRFHSNLTNLRGELKQFLFYDGQKLVSLDVKNSQPFLSCVLLSDFFYKKLYTTNERPYFNAYNCAKHYAGQIWKQLKDEIRKVEEMSTSTESFMHTANEGLLNKKDVTEYFSLVCSGKFYEWMIAELFKLEKRHYSRKEVKEVVFKVFFGNPKYGITRKAKVFQKLFPSVFEVFLRYKKPDYTFLSRLLQQIEAHIVLHRICSRIQEEKPKLPIFTIHDNILTIQGQEEYVNRVMIEEISKATQHTPTIEITKY